MGLSWSWRRRPPVASILKSNIAIEVVFDGSLSFDGDPIPLLCNGPLLRLGEAFRIELWIVLMLQSRIDVAA